MCNLYAMKMGQAQAWAMTDRNGNQPPRSGIYTHYETPVVAGEDCEREMRNMLWGMPSSKRAVLDAADERAEPV